MTMIDTNAALDCLDEAIAWRLRVDLDADELFDRIGSALHRHPAFRELKIVEIDQLLGDLRRQHAHNMREAEWRLYDAFRTVIGSD
jgi:hypothetical protein